MALTGTLLSAQFKFPSAIALNPIPQLEYTIEIKNDQLGILGTRSYNMEDPNVIANVMSYVQQMIPVMETQTGLPISIPTANTGVTANT